MAFLAAVPMAMLVGAGLSAIAGIMQGVAAKRSADEQAEQLERFAGTQQAGAQRAAADERRRASFVSSRARAVAGAGGGAVSDPTVVNIFGDIGAEGEYRALTELYTGDERALALRRQAAATKQAGRAARGSAFLQAGASAFTFGSMAHERTYGFGTSMYDKYGGGGPGGFDVAQSDIYRSDYPI